MNTSNGINQIKKSAIHEMTRLSIQYDDLAFFIVGKTYHRRSKTHQLCFC